MALKTPEKQILPIAPSTPDLDRLTKWAADITRVLHDNLARIARKANEQAFTGDVSVTGNFSVTGTFTYQGANIDNRYVNVTGDTMTGSLALTGGTTQLIIGGTDGSSANALPGILLRKRSSGFSETIGATNGSGTETGRFGYNDTSSYWYMRANGVVNDAIQFNTNGIPLFGGQIAFPATQNPSSNANTLDDYEENIWTPGISFGGGTTGITYTTQQGSYTKIGRMVFVQGRVTLSAKGTSTGQMLITGLPFTSNGNVHPAWVGYYNNLATVVGGVDGYVAASSTTIALVSEGTASVANLTDVNATNTSDIVFSALYNV